MSRIITFGEIMGRLAAPGNKRLAQAMPGTLDITFAGAEANVAVSIAQLGGEAAFVTALPEHAVADAVVANLRALGVDTRHILRTAEGRLGLFFHEAGINQRPGNVIYDRAGSSVSITPAEAYDWGAVFRNAAWLHLSGITPAISAVAAQAALHAAREARAGSLPVSLDINFRSKLWRWDPPATAHELAARTIGELMPFVTVFIGALDDAGTLFGMRPRAGATDPLLDVARQITTRFPHVTHVAMTLRAFTGMHTTWAGMLYDRAADAAFYAPANDGTVEPYVIPGIVDRLGAGDAFAAGLIFALTAPDLSAPQQAVRFASANSCLAHSIAGDFNCVTRAEVEALIVGNSGGGVNR